MLSRVADSIYWMSRYVERAENVARFIDVNLQLMLDDPSGEGQQWLPLVNTTGDEQAFEKRIGKPTQENVIHFLTFDPENPNSILSCVRAARENARTVREIISSEMWLQVNKFYLMLNSAAEDNSRALNSPHEFFTEVRNANHLFNGITAATMTHGEPWHFFHMGRMLERADKTSRILDVKYFILLRSAQDVGTPFDDIQWAAVLRSASAFEMYRKKHGRISPLNVVEFLLLDREFPRAINFSLTAARDSLHAISGTPLGTFRYAPEKLLGQLCSDLSYAAVDEIVNAGLHEYLDDLQNSMNQVGAGIFETFFASKTPKPAKKQTQSQEQRIGILTAGGDTPALNATIAGAVTRANQLKIEIIGLIKGFNSLFNPRVPHVLLNPLYQEIPELDPTKGGSLIGSSRDFVDPEKKGDLDLVVSRLQKLGIEGLICVGGDGTLNGLQPLAERLPTVLSPKTIDNDLGLNYASEPDEFVRVNDASSKSGFRYKRTESRAVFDLEHIVNYATPGYATAVFVSAQGVERIRTTAESHRRIAIIEVMGRHSGYIALGTAYGRPDIILVPEQPLDLERLVERVKHTYDLQKNVVIVCGEGIVDEQGRELGAESKTTDPAGNVQLTGAAEALRAKLIQMIGDKYFQLYRRGDSAREAIFTRKVGHTQRGGRPILFDRFYAAQQGAKAVELLAEGRNNAVSILQYNSTKGFHVDGFDANRFRDRWGLIHARSMHLSLYDAHLMKPSRMGIDYLTPIFTDAIGEDDMEHTRQTLFASGNLTQPYHSINTDVNKRIRYMAAEAAA